MTRLLFFILLILASRIAAGCSYDLRAYNTLEKRFVSSSIVVTAEVVSSRREKFQYDDRYEGTREFVEFRVLKVWKGAVKPGMKLVTSTDIAGCGLNVLNSPPIIEDLSDRPIVFGKIWVLYLRGDSPYELTQQLDSSPLQFAAKEVLELDRLATTYHTRQNTNATKSGKPPEPKRTK